MLSYVLKQLRTENTAGIYRPICLTEEELSLVSSPFSNAYVITGKTHQIICY